MALQIRRIDEDALPEYWKMQIDTFLANGDTAGPIHETLEHVQRDYQRADMYQIMFDDTMIGGCCIAYEKHRTYRIQRFFISPMYQNQHYGKKAIQMILNQYDWQVLLLDTPKHQLRNLHFYKSLGFQELYEKNVGDGYILIELENRRMIL